MVAAIGACARFVWRTYSSGRFERNYSAVAAGMISGEGFAAVVVALAEFAGASPLAAVPGRCECDAKRRGLRDDGGPDLPDGAGQHPTGARAGSAGGSAGGRDAGEGSLLASCCTALTCRLYCTAVGSERVSPSAQAELPRRGTLECCI